MLITTEIEWGWDVETESYVPLSASREDYHGPVEECKGSGGGKAVVGLALSIAVPVFAPQFVSGLGAALGATAGSTMASVVGGAVFGGAMGAISTGSLRGAVTGAIGGGLTGYMGAPSGVESAGTSSAGVAASTSAGSGMTAGADALAGSSLAQSASTPLMTLDPNGFGLQNAVQQNLGMSYAPGAFGAGSVSQELAAGFGAGAGYGVGNVSVDRGFPQSSPDPNAPGGLQQAVEQNLQQSFPRNTFEGATPAAQQSQQLLAQQPSYWEQVKQGFVDNVTDPKKLGSRLLEGGIKAGIGSLAERPDFGYDAYGADARSLMEKQGRLVDLQTAQYQRNVPGLQDQATGLAQIASNPMFTASQSVTDFRLGAANRRQQAHDQLVRAGYVPGSPSYTQAMSRLDQQEGLGRVNAFNTGYGQGVSQGMGALSSAKSLHDQPNYTSMAAGYGALGWQQMAGNIASWNAQQQSAKAMGDLFFPASNAREDELKRAGGLKPSGSISY